MERDVARLLSIDASNELIILLASGCRVFPHCEAENEEQQRCACVCVCVDMRECVSVKAEKDRIDKMKWRQLC